jgi:NDP-sugar pyrophosphorylase family protein
VVVIYLKHEAIILCGGEGWRLKPDIWTPKPLLKISENRTLLDRQISWLLDAKFDKVVLASNRSFPESSFFTNPKVEPCIERRKLGTGGAVKRAIALINENRFYVMNVDDIVFLNPRKLYEANTAGATMLLAKPQLPFGAVSLEGDRVLTFHDRPLMDTWVNAGHYIFSKEIVEKYFPVEGDFESIAMHRLSEEKNLRGVKYNGDWLTLNTMKDLLKIRNYFAENVEV